MLRITNDARYEAKASGDALPHRERIFVAELIQHREKVSSREPVCGHGSNGIIDQGVTLKNIESREDIACDS